MRRTHQHPVRRSPVLRDPLLFLLAALTTVPAHALTLLEGCRPTDSPLVCQLKSFLTFLYATAGILALLLLVAIAAAIAVYRRNSRKLKAKDRTPHAN